MNIAKKNGRQSCEIWEKFWKKDYFQKVISDRSTKKVFPNKFADKEVLDESEAAFLIKKEFMMLVITGKFCRMLQR